MLYARALEESKLAVFSDVCLRTDTPNFNGRVYPRDVMAKLVADMQQRVNNRSLLGGLITEPNLEGWPVTSGISLSKMSHVVTDLRLDDNGDLIATVDVLATPNGKLAVELLESNALGLFTRGTGSVVKDEAGHDVVQPDFMLDSVDFCLKEKKTWPQRDQKSLPETPDSSVSTD